MELDAIGVFNGLIGVLSCLEFDKSVSALHYDVADRPKLLKELA